MTRTTRPAKPYSPIKRPKKLPDLRSLIDEQHINLLPYRDWQPLWSWVYVERNMPYPDHHWLNVCRADGFEAAMRRLYMTASLHATYASTLVRSFWAVYTGGGLLPGAKVKCQPEPAITKFEREVNAYRFDEVVNGIDRQSLAFPVYFWGLRVETLDELENILYIRREAIAHYPDPLAADSLTLINLLPKQIKRQP